MDAASVSSASSSDDDEEFLTYGQDDPKHLDREALVRKKLLENFYGKTAVAAAAPSGESSGTDDEEDEDEDEDSRRKDDLDSANFDVEAHTRLNVTQASVHRLLETEETLALSVRTLESTMQTLVYENYARFIDATDAIKSIGVNVQANETGLASLSSRMEAIHQSATSTEAALGSLRDQVAEKLRVQRLLTRLDALLKLPQTLRQLIAAGKYRTAASNYLSARNILRQHRNHSFESLKSIESECTGILQDLRTNLLRKLGHWSGRLSLATMATSDDPQPVVAQLPKNVAEIFQVAGALYILQEHAEATEDDEEKDELDADDLQSMAMDATTRIFDRMLDSHLIAVQERRFGMTELDATTAVKGSTLVPSECLEAILEVATLYSMSFEQKAKLGYLAEFVKEAFDSVLSHVRGVLLDESANAGVGHEEEDASAHDEADPADAVYEEISGALTVLVQSVREVASALTLPEVGMDTEMAANFVDQALQLTETLVRRRVEQKFQDLRVSVIQECLNPFVEQAAGVLQKPLENGTVDISEIVQIASSTLSNCLQLVDDTIRSVLSSSVDEEGQAYSSASPDLPILKDSVEQCIGGFVEWLANALEFLAGGELSDPKYLVDMSQQKSGGLSECWDDSLQDMIVATRNSLYEASLDTDEDAKDIPPDFILALAEMCRLAEASVAENLDQSMSAHIGGKKKSKGMFPSGGAGHTPHESTSLRFQQAAARVLVLFTTKIGFDAAHALCENMGALAEENIVVEAPRQETCAALRTIKTTVLKCADLFGGPKRGSPLEEVDQSAMPSITSQIQRKTGLQLDVERLFKENVSIFPETLDEVEFGTHYIAFNILKIASSSLLEYSRCQSFSMEGFSQLQLDVELMKHLVEHYIKSDFSPNGTDACMALKNLLSDVLLAAGEHCTEEGYPQDAEILRETKQRLHGFLTDSEKAAERDAFIIDSE